MPVPTSFSDLDTVAANNSPPGTETAKGNVDNYLRAGFSFIKQLYTTKAALGANADITSMTALNSLNSGSLAGLRNRIINGNMQIDQRNNGAAQTFTAGAALAYCVDRWYGYCTGANVTGQRVAGSSTSQYRYQFTGAASVTGIGFGQRIEAANSYDLNGTTQTFGIDLANSLLTTVTWTAYYANTADTFGTLASPTRTQIATGTFTVSSTVTRYYAQIAVPAAATTGIEIVLSVGAQTSGTWTIGKAQFLPGTASESNAEFRPVGMELALCQRYLPYLEFRVNAPVGTGQNISTVASNIVVNLPVPARTPPTGVSGPAAANFYLTDATYIAKTCTGYSLAYAGINGVILATTVASGLAAGNATVMACGGTFAITFTGCEL